VDRLRRVKKAVAKIPDERGRTSTSLEAPTEKKIAGRGTGTGKGGNGKPNIVPRKDKAETHIEVVHADCIGEKDEAEKKEFRPC